jgi:hypothetical protein
MTAQPQFCKAARRAPLIDRPQRNAPKRPSVVANPPTIYRVRHRPPLIHLPRHRRAVRCTGSNSIGQLACSASNPHGVCRTITAHHARFPPLEAFGRRPPECAAPSIMWPASETLHKSSPQRIRSATSRHGTSALRDQNRDEAGAVRQGLEGLSDHRAEAALQVRCLHCVARRC